MEEIIVISQAEFDAVPIDFGGRIIVKFGTPYKRAIVNRRFLNPVVATGNSSVEAREHSSVVAIGNSSVEARDHSSVEAWEHSSVEARGNSSVEAREHSSVVAWEHSSVVAIGNSSVEAREHSSVVAREHSSVVAWENSSVVAWEHSSVEACGNSQVLDCTNSHDITANGNARIVYNPKNITEYLLHYGIQQSGGKAKLYKAVHKRNGRYFSDKQPDFEYAIGDVAIADGLTTDQNVDCCHGIHIAYKEFALDFGRSWHDLAILEVEADVSGIVVPRNGSGKVRADRVLVLREVPLEECGLLGKIMAKKQRAE